MKTLTNAIVGLTTALTVFGAGNTAMDLTSSAPDKPSTLCSDIWQVGNTIPADYTGCDFEDGTRYTSPFEPRACFGDLTGPDYFKSPDLQLSARAGGLVLDGEGQARMLAECLGMSDWLLDDGSVPV